MRRQDEIQGLIIGVQKDQESFSDHCMSPLIPFHHSVSCEAYPETTNVIGVPLFVGHLPANG